MIPFDWILRLSGFPIQEALKYLDDFERQPNPDKKKWIDDRRWSIAKYHSINNAAYKKLLGNGLPGKWSDLPVMKKSDLQAPFPDLLSEPFKQKKLYVSNTSGSSGHPFFFAKDKFAHAMVWGYIFRRYHELGIRSQSIQARFYGIPLGKFSYFKERLKDFLMNRIRLVVFDMGDEALERFLNTFRRDKIDYVYGYTNSMLLFANFLKRKGLTLKQESPNLFLCIVTSEVCTPEDKQELEKVFGVPVIREYGASELDVIAIENREGRWSINESNLFVEVLSDDNKILSYGEEGKIVITSLHNHAMPFIRYEVGDRGSIDMDDQGLILQTLSGRMNDTILLPSGKKSPGFTFYYVSRNILEKGGKLKEFIIRQTALDSFEFDVVAYAPLTKEDFQSIRSIVDQYLEPGLNLKINQVEKIERPASGKIKHFYSNL